MEREGLHRDVCVSAIGDGIGWCYIEDVNIA